MWGLFPTAGLGCLGVRYCYYGGGCGVSTNPVLYLPAALARLGWQGGGGLAPATLAALRRLVGPAGVHSHQASGIPNITQQLCA
jgi:hypothetical protein